MTQTTPDAPLLSLVGNPYDEALPLLATRITSIMLAQVLSEEHYATLHRTGFLDITGLGLSEGDNFLRQIRGFPPRELTLDVAPGAVTTFMLPIRYNGALRASEPRCLMLEPDRFVACQVVQCPPEWPVPLVEPGAFVPLAGHTDYRRFVFQPDEPTLPTDLLRAMREDGTVVTLRSSRPVPPLVTDTNPLERDAHPTRA